ncbi:MULTISPECIES: BGTF surface domain-containing protein [Haloferax]|uniref:PGF-CTERM sorting domain-containing protein n=2 Tax=Haloferax TaxID=2251 RepID=A0A6G1Z577_9EURY|nr:MULTISPECIES: BGTF surface domain-containing protein [Haloferax]KAB1188835.1 PGF-CTERM sorting domain-containing protein [Haloferax sp. CBA1149]MRW81551.1 PGF-CTERM sorting domain-containing protein [Haloferax marinisediminis]
MRPPHTRIVFFGVLLLVAPASIVASDGGTAIDHQGDEIIIGAATDQRIEGTTPFESGTIIGVRVKSVGETHPFLVSKAVKVGENGSFDVVFDLSELAPLQGGPIHVEVRHNESTIHELDGVLVTKNMPAESTLTYAPPTDGTTSPPSTTTATTTTPDDSSSGIDVPGFGIVAGLVALGSVILLTRR